MKQVVDRNNFLFHRFLQIQGFLPNHACILLLVRVDVRIELCNLMCVLARSRYFDTPRPVKVEVAQRIRQTLDVELSQARVVLRHVEVGWEYTALVRFRWSQVEVEFG